MNRKTPVDNMAMFCECVYTIFRGIHLGKYFQCVAIAMASEYVNRRSEFDCRVGNESFSQQPL